MHSLLRIAALFAVVSPVAAQNDFDLYCGRTSATARSLLPGTSAGWITQNYPSAVFRGLAQSIDPRTGRLVGRITDLHVVLQDSDGSTSQSFSLGIFRGDPHRPDHPDPDPDPTTGRPRPQVSVGPLATPRTLGSGSTAWRMSAALQTPFDGVPAHGDVFVGVRVSSNPVWTRDGLSIHFAAHRLGVGGDNPSATAINTGSLFPSVHSIDESRGNLVSLGLDDRVNRLWFSTEGAVLRTGAMIQVASSRGPNPNYGIGGLFPDHALRGDGLALQLDDASLGASPTAMAAVVLYHANQALPPFPAVATVLPGIQGAMWIDAARSFTSGAIFPLSPVPGVTGSFESVPIPSGSLRFPAAYGRFVVQGLLTDPATGTVKLTQATRIDSL